MNHLMYEELVRVNRAERLGEARAEQRVARVAAARRLSRRAERAAQQARLAVARAL